MGRIRLKSVIFSLALLLLSTSSYAQFGGNGLSGGSGGSAVTGGTVTSITAAQGLTGGAITSSGTIGLPTGTAGQILVENAGATGYASVSLSQDCTNNSTGVLTCTKAGNGSGAFATGALTSSSLTIGSDNTVVTMSRISLDFPIAATVATTTIEYGVRKIVKAITIENAVVSVQVFSCAANPTFKIRDCGSDITCGGSITDIATSASITATGASDMTINSANIAAGDYLVAEFSAGTCVAFNAGITAMARPQ